MQTSVFKLLLQTEFQVISKHVIKEASDHWILSAFQRNQFMLSDTVCANTLQQFYSYFPKNWYLSFIDSPPPPRHDSQPITHLAGFHL